jgi:hypothetical protein
MTSRAQRDRLPQAARREAKRINDRRVLAFVILLSSLVIPARAAPPGLENVFPAGGQAGQRADITVAGKDLEKTSPQAWCSEPKIAVLAGDKPKKFVLGIGSDVLPGPYLLRLFTNDGATPPRIIEVGKLPEQLEKEPNDAFADVKSVEPAMNVTLNGVLEKAGDVDGFALRVQKGKVVTLELHGYALGSPMDPAMRLLSDRGVEIAGGHDTHNLDPRIQHTPTVDGVLFVQVFAFAHPPAADVALKGSANHVYRLTVTDGPAKAPPADEAKALTIPASINGCIAKAREEDAYTFTAKKGDDLQCTLRAQALRSPLDATLRIEDADGKVLQQADDGEKENLDPALRWKAPKDGSFKLVVADRFHQGSADHAYELAVKPFAPSLSGTLDTHAYVLAAGKTVEVKLNVKTSGTFSGKIQAKATQLPAGVTADPVDVPAKGGDVKLTLKAAPEAAVSQAPFAVEIVTSAPDAVQTVLASYAIPFTEPRGDLLIMSDTHPWLTVTAKK